MRRRALNKATGDGDSRDELSSWTDSKISVETKKPELLESSGIPSWNFHTVTLLGTETFSGKQVSKRDRHGPPHTSQSTRFWDQSLLDLLHSTTSSLESARGQSNNSEREQKKSPQDVLELTVVWHLVSEGRLFYQKEKRVTWTRCLSQVILQSGNEARLLEHSTQCSLLQALCFFDVPGFITKIPHLI